MNEAATSTLDTTRLFEQVCSLDTLRGAFRTVKRNKGAAGIDKVTIEDFEKNLEQELARLSNELGSWCYEPSPVRRVEIPKPSGGMRKLGVPTIKDRVVQSALKQVLEPIFEPSFSDNSYGFRPGRNQRQAVEAAQQIIQSGKKFVVDIDLAQFFDRIHHDRLIHRIKQQVPDTRILRLIGKILRSGVMQDGLVQPTEEGSPQGGPLSPLLSNIVLDELDKELERRGLRFCRFADDCNIFCGCEKSAVRVMKNVSKFIEKQLRLKVNTEKSRVARPEFVKFLGMTIIGCAIAISAASMQKARDRVRELTPGGTSQSIEQTVSSINSWYVGWANYFAMAQYPSQLKGIEAHIRRRLRSRIVLQQKTRRNLLRRLLKRGVKRKLAKTTAYSPKRRWALAHTRAMEQAYSNRWFTDTLGLKIRSDRKESHWFDVNTWIRLP